MPLTQEPRTLNIKTPLGDDALLLVSFTGQEEISRLSEFRLDLISDNNAIAAPDIVGKDVTISIKKADESPRFFHGFVNRFFAGDEDEEGRRNYRMTVVPWLWFLTLKTDCRIFQEKDVKEIIEQVFDDLGFSDYDTSQIKGHHPKREYCVQYRESDYAFVSRLCEDEGIFWFVQHDDGAHKIIFGDSKNAYVDCEENEVDYPRDMGTRAMEDHITRWEHRYEFRTGKFAQTDYNFETPSNDLMTSEQTIVDLPGMDKYEQYDFPGAYGKTDDGQPLTKIRMEELEAATDVVDSTSLCKTFTCGGKFKIREHRSSSEEGKGFVLTKIEHFAHEPFAYETGTTPGFEYRNEFQCIPDAVVFRPERITPRPMIRGVQSAVVVGPSGETIFPDEMGRVKVQFYWDRNGKRDEESSCWIRVSNNWGGANWGIVNIPHVGQEVVVSFMEGDPDRPLVVGRVYNAEQMPPLELPANKSKCIIQDHGGNQIIMEGNDGGQQIALCSPTEDSKISIGAPNAGNIFIKTAGDMVRRILGPEVKEVVGDVTQTLSSKFKRDIDGEAKFTFRSDVLRTTIGSTNELFVGIKDSKSMAATFEKFLGYKESICMAVCRDVFIGAKVSFKAAVEADLTVGHKLNANYAGETVLNPATDDEKIASLNEVIAAAMKKAGKEEATIGSLVEKIGDMSQKIASLEQKVGDLKMEAGGIQVVSSGQFMLKGPTLNVKARLEAHKDVDVHGTLWVKSSRTKLC